MPLAIWFWAILILGALFNGGIGFWEKAASWRPIGVLLWIVILLGILGWRAFGGPVSG